MLDWLSNLTRKTDHPMHSVEEAQRLLTGLSDEPLKALEEITSWLTTLTQATGFHPAVRLAVIKIVDEAGQPFEPEVIRVCLKPHAVTEFERQQLWAIALQFWERLEQACRLCLDSMRSETGALRAPPAEVALVHVRALRALAGRIRLLHLRYMPVPPDAWHALFDLYLSSEAAACDAQRVFAYPGDAVHTTARQELLRAMLLEIARPDSMPARQTDLAARVAARYANACVFDAHPRSGCNWMVDLAAPRPPEFASPAASAHARFRYFGAAAVTVKLRELIRRLTAEPGAREQRFGEEYAAAEKLAVLQRLTNFWGEQPPRPADRRTETSGEIEVVRSFAAACSKIPRVHYAKWSELIAGLDLKLMERLGIAPEPAPVATERWIQHDASAWGLGAAVSRAGEADIRIGTLCALKSANGPWWIGAVRRLFRDDDGRAHAGIEVLAKKPATLLLRRVGHGGMSVQEWSAASDASGTDYMNVLLLGATRDEKTRHELLVARGEFIAGLVYEAMIGDAKQHFKFEELLEEGAEFARVRFTRIAAGARGDARK